MGDEGAVAEASVVDAGTPDAGFEDTSSTEVSGDTAATDKQEKLDGRNQPDALKKRISELRRQADSITDPAQKASLLADAKALNDTVGKGRAYEEIYPTVREAREVKTLVESFGGREGLARAQETLTRVQAIDKALEAGDPSAAESMWKDAPQGMVKLAPMIFSELEKNAPQEYEKAVVPHAIKFLDKNGFPKAFDRMVGLFKAGKTADADAIAEELAGWVVGHRTSTTKEAPKADPETERLRKELETRNSKDQEQATNAATKEVEDHAFPLIERFLKTEVGKLGLNAAQMTTLRKHAWDHLQDTRNADQTYKTVVNSKFKQGMPEVAKYVKSETEARASDAARYVANLYYGHQLKNGAVSKPNPTATPLTPGITKGKEPSPSEIDYGSKGIQAAKKAGFRDLGDMILSGKAPLKAGGIRQWR